MRLSYLAELCGFSNPKKATELEITTSLESKIRLADAVMLRANEGRRLDPEIREMVNVIAGEGRNFDTGTAIYSTATRGPDAETDPSKIPMNYWVKNVRGGFFVLMEKRADGSSVRVSNEVYGSDTLEAEAVKRNQALTNKASSPLVNEVSNLVQVEMQGKGVPYDVAFANVKRRRPDLWAAMRDPSQEQKRQHTPRARR